MAHYKTYKKFTIHHNLYRIIFIHVFIKKWKIKILYIIIVVCIIIHHMSTLINNLYIYIYFLYIFSKFIWSILYNYIHWFTHSAHRIWIFFLFETEFSNFKVTFSQSNVHCKQYTPSKMKFHIYSYLSWKYNKVIFVLQRITRDERASRTGGTWKKCDRSGIISSVISENLKDLLKQEGEYHLCPEPFSSRHK